MVHARAKKAKGDDAFTTRKQKVGRKKLAPATATRAEVHARTLRIQARATPTAITMGGPAAAAAAQDASSAPAGAKMSVTRGGAGIASTAPPAQRTFGEDMVGIRHYKESVRKSCFESLYDAAFQRRGLGPVQRLQLVISSLDALTDTDVGVRHEATRIVRTLLHESSAVPDASVAARVLDGTRIALTHAQGGVRRCGCEVLLSLLKSWPGQVRSLLLQQQQVPGESAKLVHWTVDVATGHVASLPAVEALCKELLAPPTDSLRAPTSASSSSSISALVLTAGEVLALCDKIVPWLSTLWKESVELQAALFRSPETVAKALCCGKILTSLALALQHYGVLSKAFKKRLRDLLLERVPLSMRDMSSAHSEQARALALVIAEACVPIAAVYHDAFRAIPTYVTVSIASVQATTSLVRVEQLVLAVLTTQPAALALRLVDAVPALLNHVIRSASRGGGADGGALQPEVFDLAVAILLQCCALDGYAAEPLTYLGKAVDLVPRLLFASRRLPADGAARVALASLQLLWHVFASAHPVAQVLDLPSFEARLQSVLFGFDKTPSAVDGPAESEATGGGSSGGGGGAAAGDRVPGILNEGDVRQQVAGSSAAAGGCAAVSLLQLARHVLYYIGASSPRGETLT